MPRTRRPYPPEFRREAVQLVRSGRSVKDVADGLGCSDQSLHIWVKQDQLDRKERDDGLTSAERDELRELRRRVKRLQQERQISSEPPSSSSGDPDPEAIDALDALVASGPLRFVLSADPKDQLGNGAGLRLHGTRLGPRRRS